MSLDWKNLEVRLGRCANSQWRRGNRHSINWQHKEIIDNDLWLFHTGECEMELRGGKTRLDADSIVWMRPGHNYRITQNPDEPIGMAYFHFNLITPDGNCYYPGVDEMPELLHSFHNPQWRMMGQNIIKLLKFQDFMPEERKAEKNAAAEAMFKALLMSLEFYNNIGRDKEEHTDRHRMLALEAAMLIEENSRSFIPVTELAAKFGLGRNAFTRIFSEYWQMSPQEYLINQRISRAKALLASTPQTLQEISAGLGYSDHYFFSRQFKEKTGVSPGIYRNNAVNNIREGSL